MYPTNLIMKWVSAMFTFSLMAGPSSAQAVISSNQTAAPHQGATISLQAKSTTSLAAANLTKSVTITLPKDTQMNSLKAVLNGTSVSAQFSQTTCADGFCATGLLSQIDGLRSGKNVLFATAKKQDGSAVSTRIRFAMDYSGGTGLRAMAAGNVSQVNAQQTALPTSSSFLPPAVGFKTLYPGGPYVKSPWLQLGTEIEIDSANCRSTYSVMVLDRQTLVPELLRGWSFARSLSENTHEPEHCRRGNQSGLQH